MIHVNVKVNVNISGGARHMTPEDKSASERQLEAHRIGDKQSAAHTELCSGLRCIFGLYIIEWSIL